MKKILLFACLLVVLTSCKKEEKLQPSWWDKLWHKEMVIMDGLNSKHKDVILPKIKLIRTTLQQYVMWDSDTIQVYGPGGYKATSEKAWRVWNETFQKLFMPDTLVPSQRGEWATIIKAYLDLRRDYNKDKAFKKLWLCIPKDLYDQDERFWEWFLSSVSDYLTTVLGGPDAWTDGTRQHWIEMQIYHLPTTPDPKDPWGYNCSAQTRITDWYLQYTVGPQDKSILWDQIDQKTKIQMTNKIIREKYENYDQKMMVFKRSQAEKRFELFKNVKDEQFNIAVEDLETKLTTIAGGEYYVLQLPAVPTRQ